MHDSIADLHRIPSRKETAMKIARDFLGFDAEAHALRRARRSLDDDTAGSRSKRQMPLDQYNVVYMVDSSNSVRKRGFNREKVALRLLTEKALPGTVYSTITFSTEAEISFRYANRSQAIEKLNDLPYMACKTNTQLALNLAEMIFFNNTLGPLRPGRRRILIFTDGQSNVKEQMTLYRAFRLKKRGVEIYVVAVGKYLYGMHEIIGLATSSSHHLYRVRSMKDFVKIVQLIPRFEEFLYHNSEGRDFEYIHFPTPKP
ncbi:predicted protein [Nematostella vectensis]|uniref:VWFA domain-containing protein n=1 Tax=Nematostella vectensis TaxID=45351 RepID=A7RF21_NEMVE|nr:predicted protein [Nematostella vectensis]|eukprot:XP_001642078.1 predicted protein [Nematostella vectensis]